jgi:hypothetical protein
MDSIKRIKEAAILGDLGEIERNTSELDCIVPNLDS